jgi:hypothetical protein
VRRQLELPVVHQQNLYSSDGVANGECYLLDGTRTDLLDVAAKALKEDNLIEFNRFKEFKKFKGSVNEFGLVQANWFEKNLKLRHDRSAIHLNRLLIAVVPSVNQGTPGNVTIRLIDNRMEEPFGTVFSCTNPVVNGYIYCINLGYSVAAAELDFRMKVVFDDVPIKNGLSPIWVKTAFHLSESADPVFLQGTMSLGAAMRPDSHTELLGSAALLMNEVNGHRKSFSGLGDEVSDLKITEGNSSVSDEVGPQDSISQVGSIVGDERGVSFSSPIPRG